MRKVLILLVAIVIMFQIGCNQKGTSVQPISTPAKISWSMLFLTSYQLHYNYSINEIAADMNYKGKTIAVMGFVQTIGKSFGGGNLQIELETGLPGNMWGSDLIQCQFKDNQENRQGLALLRLGQKVMVVGRCDGKLSVFGSILLNNCHLARGSTEELQKAADEVSKYGEILLIGEN